MKPRHNQSLLYVGSGNLKTQINHQGQLPKILKEIQPPNQQILFTKNDVKKIVEQILKRGIKYSQLKKELDFQDCQQLEKRISNSSFVQFAVRKEMNIMGDERRLGTGLRGLSRLLLQQFQCKCWPTIQIQAELMLKQAQQENQKQKLFSLLDKPPNPYKRDP